MTAFAFAVSDTSGSLALTDMETFCAALDELINREVVPFWPDFAGSRVRLVTEGFPREPGEVPLLFDQTGEYAQDLAYHTTADGLPIGRVQLDICRQYGASVWVAGAHEALEILGNPTETEFVTAGGRRWPREIVDFVTSAEFVVDGIAQMPLCSCVTPAYFDPAGAAPFDLQGLVEAPLPAIPPGGWAMWQDENGQTQSAYGEHMPDAVKAHNEAKLRFGGRAHRIARRGMVA